MSLILKAMDIAFDKKQKPSMFLSNFFKKVQLDTIAVELRGRAVKTIYSVDVKLGTGGRRSDLSNYDITEYVVPEYNDYGVVGEADMFKVQHGETQYSTKQIAKITKLITDKQQTFSDMQRRAEEKQASDALFNGYVVLADGSKIQFNKKPTHSISKASAKWNSPSVDPLADIVAGAKLCIEDGLISTSVFNLILEDKGVGTLLSNENFRKNCNKEAGISRTNINMPEELTPGAMFHGQFSAGAYRFNLWSYTEKYTIPTGFGFANEGTKVGYVPEGCGILMPMDPDFKRYYGAINNIAALTNEVAGSKMNLVEKEQLPYAYDELKSGSVYTVAGCKSRPLLVPADPDCFVTFKDVA